MNSYHTDLVSEAILQITGPDSLVFLQGQTTCDTTKVSPDQAVPGAYCTPQGRTVCDFILLQLGEDQFGLRMRRDIIDTATATFGKYIVFSKAELGGGQWRLLGLWGEDARSQLLSSFGHAPNGQYHTSRGSGCVLLQLDEAGQQFEIYLSAAAAPLSEETLGEQAAEGSWQALGITAAIGRIEAATSGEFIPQMLNYDLTGFINFTKGCYTGQEVVARLHYRGKPKRRMYLANISGDKVVEAGSSLYLSSKEQSVGNIVNSAIAADGAVTALACATAEALENELHLNSPEGKVITLAPPPYPLSSADAED